MMRKVKIIIIVAAILTVTGVLVPSITVPLTRANTINVTLIQNAGIMIENKGVRIYIDPYQLTSEYIDLPADAVLITHPHGDHFEGTSINLIDTDDTTIIHPESCTEELGTYADVGVNPMDQIQVEHINITAYYMYTLPVGEYPASHPAEANWTSYIIDIDGLLYFTLAILKT